MLMLEILTICSLKKFLKLAYTGLASNLQILYICSDSLVTQEINSSPMGNRMFIS